MKPKNRETDLVIEACVETYAQARNAQQSGAHRIELCSHLEHGGLTPDFDLTKRLLRELHIPIKVMIRPRAGDFVHTKAEIEQMASEIRKFKEAGVAEIVLGVLDESGQVNLEQLRYLAEKAAPLPITFHKAIDETNDPMRELERMTGVDNVRYILTSGKAATARQGSALIRKMTERFGDRFTIIAAGKVTDENLAELHELIGAREYHGRKIVGLLDG